MGAEYNLKDLKHRHQIEGGGDRHGGDGGDWDRAWTALAKAPAKIAPEPRWEGALASPETAGKNPR